MERVLVLIRNALTGGLMLFAALACSADDNAVDTIDYSETSGPIADALSSVARPERDRSDDAMRRPDRVLAFLGIQPGMTIFEIEAGTGYYTELFSALVGPQGRIISQEAPAFRRFVEADMNTRLAGNRLANVEVQYSLFDDLGAADGSADLVTWMLGPHELFFEPTGGETFGDPDGAFAEAYRVLKSGGYFYVIDHAAPDDYSGESSGSLHRINESVVRDLAAGAGFKFVTSSDILRNPDDPRTENVFNPEIRRRTDRFFHKYLKPLE